MKTAILVSGGVDSSTALALLAREPGRQLTAFYLKIWLEEELHFLGDCPWEEDLAFVRAICRQYQVPLKIVPLQSEYRERVVEHALAELRAGRTPSPDIWCNQFIKFGEFFRVIGDEFDQVATGHYARIEQRDGLYWLRRAPDPVKDQSYFLARLDQRQLSRLIFPIGGYQKFDVRRLARELDVPSKDRRDSQGICFLGKIQYRDFVKFHLGERPGPIVELENGRELGRHQGVWFYTIGQRQGLGLSGGPWYVVRRDMAENIVYVSHSTHYLEQARGTFVAEDVRWIAAPPAHHDLQLKLRHGPQLIDCQIEPLGTDRYSVVMDREDPGVAPGQWSIFYDGDYCLGAGIIA